MKLKIVTVVATAAALSFTAGGSAAADPLGHETVRPAQVNGSQLQAAMLPPSAFGGDLAFLSSLNTGRKLLSTRAKDYPPGMSCSAFEGKVNISVFGNTAGAVERYRNPNPRSIHLDAIYGGQEYVLQFAAAATAAKFYNQAWAKYSACVSLAESLMIGKATVDTLSVRRTTISGDRAFLVTQGVTVPRHRQRPLYLLYLYVVAGTNVYSLSDLGGTNDEPSVTLMGDLIHRVQALYPHH